MIFSDQVIVITFTSIPDKHYKFSVLKLLTSHKTTFSDLTWSCS